MKPIDFTQYPKIFKYVKQHVGKDYFKPFPYSKLDEDTFVEIIEAWITEYEEHIDLIVKNTLLVYNLTNEETGYKALTHDWDTWRPHYKGKAKRFTKKIVKDWWDDKIASCINHIYQHLQTDWSDIQGGVTGCLITMQYNISFIDSDKKGVKKKVVCGFNMSLDLGHSFHYETDLHK